MPPSTRVLHVSDTRLRAEHADSDDLGGVVTAVDRAVDLDVEVLLHTGNLFSTAGPNVTALGRIRDALDRLDAAGIRLAYVEGRRDRAGDWNPWADDALGDHPAVVHLDRTPTDVGDDLALFGIDFHPSAAFQTLLAETDDPFTPASGVSHQLLALSQSIAPPVDRDAATAQAFEVATSVNLYLDAIPAGSTRTPQQWEHDDSGLGVYYPGSTNPRWRDDAGGSPRGVLYEAGGDGRLDRRLVRLSPADPGEELSTLRELLADYETMDLTTADTRTLVDLYGLVAEAKSVLDDRRKSVRDVLLERTTPEETASGAHASVHHQHSTSRRLRDESDVFEALERVGVDPDRVTETTEPIHQEAVATLVEDHPELSSEDVFERRVRETVRKRDVSLDPRE